MLDGANHANTKSDGNKSNCSFFKNQPIGVFHCIFNRNDSPVYNYFHTI